MTTRTPHTTGPWHAANLSVFAENGERIADAHGTIHSYDESRSNARLMAASTELLDALQKCLQWLDNLEDQGALRSMNAFMDAAPNDFSRSIARAAIAKALGAE